MKKYQSVFDRYEKKYILTQDQVKGLLESIDDYIIEGAYATSSIHSIYFDDEDFTMIQKSLSKPPYKEKVRARFYGNFSEDAPCYLEIKKKFNGIVYKRRFQVSYAQAKHFLEAPETLQYEHQIGKELQWIVGQFHLKPQYYIYYDRHAYCSKDDEEIRLTFDQHLLYRSNDLNFDQQVDGTSLLDEELVLLEVKTPDALPLWLVRALEALSIQPTSFSKVGTAYLKENQYGTTL